MFGSKKVSEISAEVETIIGKDTHFKGNITAKGSIRVDGQLDGEVTTSSDVVVGVAGDVTVQIKARNVTVAGKVTGNIDAVEKLELLPTAKLCGDIKVGMLIVGEGAVFKGSCEMRHESENRGKEAKGNGKG
jgi:cytoskeletal protein CcmA (bactofilin family)